MDPGFEVGGGATLWDRGSMGCLEGEASPGFYRFNKMLFLIDKKRHKFVEILEKKIHKFSE